MAQPICPLAQALSDLDRITLSSLHLCGAPSLRDDINNLILAIMDVLLSSARADDLSVKDLMSIATIRRRLQRLNIPATKLDEILERRIEELGRDLVCDNSVDNFKKLMKLRELLAHSVGFDCGPLNGLISKVVHGLHVTAEGMRQSLPTIVGRTTAPTSPTPVVEVPETPQQSRGHTQNNQREAAASNEESRDSSPNKQIPPNGASVSDDSTDDEIFVLRNRTASISLTESYPGTPERGRAGYEGADTGSTGNEELGEGFETSSPEAK